MARAAPAQPGGYPMTGSRYRFVMGLSVALALAVAPRADAQGTIKIATQSPLSGGQAALGEGIKLGTQLAIEKLKGNLEQKGFKVVLVPYDDQAKPDVGVANARNIIADREILGVIGHFNSGVAIPSSEVYKEVSLAMISPANTNPTVTDRGYKNVFRVCGRDDVQGVVEFFRTDAAKKGIKVLGFEGTEEKSNFDPIITPIRARKPDLIYFGGIYEQAAPFFRQARERGVKAKFMGPDGLDSSDLTKIAGKSVQGMYYTSVAGPVTVYPEAKQFADEYQKKFGKKPEPFSAQAYDATAILLKAIETAAEGGKTPTREAVSAAVRNVKHQGVTGKVEFDPKGDPKTALYFVLQVSSDDPQKWGENKESKRLTIAAPASK